jgi:hypothetical protein
VVLCHETRNIGAEFFGPINPPRGIFQVPTRLHGSRSRIYPHSPAIFQLTGAPRFRISEIFRQLIVHHANFR